MIRRILKCLKKIKYLWLLLLGCFVCCLSFSTTVSAISTSYSVSALPGNTSLIYDSSTSHQLKSQQNGRRYVSWNTSGITELKQILIEFSSFPGPIKGPGFVSGSFGFFVVPNNGDTFSDNPVNIRVNPYSPDGSAVIMLNSACTSSVYDPLVKSFSVICDYLAFVDGGPYRNFLFYFDIFIQNANVDSYNIYAYLNPVSNIQLDYSSLSASDKQWLLNNIADQVEEGQKAANQDVKNQTETATTDADTSANTQGSAADTQGQTLLGAFSGFVTAITNVSPASSCAETIDLSGYHQDLVFNVDVCQAPFPSQFSFIGTILLILMVVPLSIFTVRRMIGLFRSFQS